MISNCLIVGIIHKLCNPKHKLFIGIRKKNNITNGLIHCWWSDGVTSYHFADPKQSAKCYLLFEGRIDEVNSRAFESLFNYITF